MGRYVVKAFSLDFPVTFYRQIPSKSSDFEGILAKGYGNDRIIIEGVHGGVKGVHR